MHPCQPSALVRRVNDLHRSFATRRWYLFHMPSFTCHLPVITRDTALRLPVFLVVGSCASKHRRNQASTGIHCCNSDDQLWGQRLQANMQTVDCCVDVFAFVWSAAAHRARVCATQRAVPSNGTPCLPYLLLCRCRAGGRPSTPLHVLQPWGNRPWGRIVLAFA
jgi:hypothetical protein